MSNDVSLKKPLRLWPGIVIAAVLGVVRFGLPLISRDYFMIALFGGLICCLGILAWWLFFSRAAWPERIGAIVLMAAVMFGVSRLVDPSIAGGAMGMLFWMLAIPPLLITFVIWAVLTHRLPNTIRWVTMFIAIVLGCGFWTLTKTGGFTGDGKNDLMWRWTQTPEEKLLAQKDEPTGPSPTPAVTATPSATPAASPSVSPTASPNASVTPTASPAAAATAKRRSVWPGFRGADRNGAVRGVQIATNWSQSPPVQLWKRPIGPGWSSFAVDGDLVYTQEQRGEDEIVACYNLTTGAPVWRHKDAVRFWESNGGAGPRGTPTLSGGRVYAFGATGILNSLDAGNGAVIWSRNVATDADVKVPTWGFSSSPLVIDQIVIVAAAGKLAAYDISNGKPRWYGPSHGGSYSSPHKVTVDGVTQIVLLSDAGATSVAPSDGTVLWEYAWPGSTIVQPAVLADGDVLVSTGGGAGGLGTRRLAISHSGSGWKVEERWTSNGLKPYFNDFVVHKGYAYGFDGNILACIDLQDGKRKWKGGRYGNGQLVLLTDQDLLLVLSEEGELALVKATPEGFTEVAKVPAIEGKSWNHPVVVGDVLLVRNGQEMAAFRLSGGL